MKHIQVGRRGEEIAREFLQTRGYRLVAGNERNRFGEIDLIAKKDNVLVIVEVRTKSDERAGTPEETIGKKKKSKLIKNALSYIARVRWKGPCRIDAICVVLNGDGSADRLAHYENIVP